MNLLKKLQEQRADKVAEMEAIFAKATTEERALTSDQQADFDKIEADVRNIDESIKRIRAAEAAAEGAEAPIDGEGAGGEGEDEETDEQREQRETRQFADYIRGVVQKDAGAERALDYGTNGAIVPKTIANKIITRINEISPLVDKANRYNTKGTFDVPFYSEDGASAITVGYQDELTALTAAAGDFSETVSFGSFLAGAEVLLSKKLINNTDIDIVSKVVNLLADKFAFFLEREILIGTSGKATGLSTLTNVVDTTAISYDSLVDLTLAVKSAYRKGAFFVGSTKALGVIRKIKDDNKNPIFTNDAQEGFSGNVLGYPYFESDNVAAPEDGGRTLYFVNPTAVGVRTAKGVEIAVLNELYANKYAVGVDGWLDFDAKLENGQAAAVLTTDPIDS